MSAETDQKSLVRWWHLLLIFAVTPPWMILSAKVNMYVWGLTLGEQFGEGPTLRSWVGVSTLLFLIRRGATKSDKFKQSPVRVLVEAMVGYGIAVLVVLFAVFIIGKMQGWQ